MPDITVRDMTADDEYFVSTCSHINESDETDAAARRQLAWVRANRDEGFRAKVGLLDGQPVGFLFAMPGPLTPCTMIAGEDILVMPCLWVLPKHQRHGVGSAMLAAIEADAAQAGFRAIATQGTDHEWFMPRGFLLKQGYECVPGEAGIFWKILRGDPRPPRSYGRQWTFEPVPGKVAVDLFSFTLCQTVNVEAQRVREVVAEFGNKVLLREHNNDDPAVLRQYEISRGIFVNGEEIGWGYEAPREGIRDAIRKAIDAMQISP